MRRAPFLSMLLLLAQPLAAAPHPTPDTPIATVAALSDALAAQPGAMPLAVAVGRGFKAAPLTTAVTCMTPDQRAQWWDHHQDAGCTDVLVISETTRVESTVPDGPPIKEEGGPLRFMVLADALEPDGTQVQLNAGTFDTIALAVAEVERFTVSGLCVVRFPGELDLVCYPPARQLRTLVQRVWY